MGWRKGKGTGFNPVGSRARQGCVEIREKEEGVSRIKTIREAKKKRDESVEMDSGARGFAGRFMVFEGTRKMRFTFFAWWIFVD